MDVPRSLGAQAVVYWRIGHHIAEVSERWRFGMQKVGSSHPNWSDEGGFTALVPALPGCISEGDTRDQALANIQEAIRLYLEPVDDDAMLPPHAEVIEIAI